jgi:hypothetical protein
VRGFLFFPERPSVDERFSCRPETRHTWRPSGQYFGNPGPHINNLRMIGPNCTGGGAYVWGV